jgi:uncharacterized membrane protein AbrB (regulator of aidB expression)
MTSSRHWLALCMGSALLSAALLALHVPAAVLLGCMVCAIAVAVRGTTLAVPRTLFGWGRGCWASWRTACSRSTWARWCRAGRCFWAHAAADCRQHRAGLVAHAAPGHARHHGPVGYGAGAATAMVVMSESFGADVRLVAFMQYTRVVVVTLVAALVTRAVVGPPDSASAIPWWPPTAPQALALTAALAGRPRWHSA